MEKAGRRSSHLKPSKDVLVPTDQRRIVLLCQTRSIHDEGILKRTCGRNDLFPSKLFGRDRQNAKAHRARRILRWKPRMASARQFVSFTVSCCPIRHVHWSCVLSRAVVECGRLPICNWVCPFVIMYVCLDLKVHLSESTQFENKWKDVDEYGSQHQLLSSQFACPNSMQLPPQTGTHASAA